MNAAQKRHIRLWCTTKLTNATTEQLDAIVMRKDFIEEQPSNSFEGLDVAAFMDIIKESDFAECLVGWHLDVKIFKDITAPAAPPPVVPIVDVSNLYARALCVNGFQVDLLNPNDHERAYPIFLIDDKLYCEAKPTDEFQVCVRSYGHGGRYSTSVGDLLLASCKVDELENDAKWMEPEKKGSLCATFPRKYRLAPANLPVFEFEAGNYMPPGIGPAYVPPQLGVVSVHIYVFRRSEKVAATETSCQDEKSKTKESDQQAAAPAASAEAVRANPPVLTDEDTKFYHQPNLRCEVVKEPEPESHGISPAKRARIDPELNTNKAKSSSEPHSPPVVYHHHLGHFQIFIQDARTIRVLCGQQQRIKEARRFKGGLQALSDGAENGGVDIIKIVEKPGLQMASVGCY